MRVKTRALQGEAVTFDGTNTDELAALIGDAFEGTDEKDSSVALVRNMDGDLVRVHPGWLVCVWDANGEPQVIASSAAAARATVQAA